MTFEALVYYYLFLFTVRRLIWFGPSSCGGSYGQLRLDMVVECPPNVSAKHLAASNLMGEQREVLALIISHWN